jgi:hypothetical protein
LDFETGKAIINYLNKIKLIKKHKGYGKAENEKEKLVRLRTKGITEY